MKARKISITSDALNELFRYEPESGQLFRRKRGRGWTFGRDVGTIDKEGYRQVGINRKRYCVHRIIWLMMYGEIREDLEIDHINGIRDDNRLENLRLVTAQKNLFNDHVAKGYTWHKASGKWMAQITVNRGQIHLGLFTEKSAARAAYLEAKKKYHIIN